MVCVFANEVEAAMPHRIMRLWTIPLLTRRQVSVVIVAALMGFGSVAGCHSNSHGSASDFEPISLNAAPESYASTKWTVRSKVAITKTFTGLHCVVQGEPGAGPGPYGGIMLPAQGAKRWRLELSFADPKGILLAYVDGYNSRGKRVRRWQTALRGKLHPNRAVYEFVSEQPVQPFHPVASEGTEPIDKIHVFVRVKPGGRAVFDLYSAEIAR
jgi:hypothetical protein